MKITGTIALAFFFAPALAFAQASPSPYTSATRYDAAGRVAGTISADPDGAGPLPFLAVRTGYDGAGRPIRVETGTLSAWQSEQVAPADWGAAFTVLRTLETAYDAVGHKLRESLREGAAGTVRTLTQYSYDNVGRLECTAVRMNPATYASLPASACTPAAAGSDGPDRITRIVYDAAGQRLQQRIGVGSADEGATATWAYSANGRITAMIDGNGNRAELHYDGYDRQDRWTFPSATRPTSFDDSTPAAALASAGAANAGDYEAYGYDANGNRTSSRKRDGRHIAYQYDALNRVAAKTYPQGGAEAVAYSYDLRNLQLSALYSASGLGVTNAYDGFGRLASSSVNMTGTAYTLTHAYDRDGDRTALGSDFGYHTDFTYDGLDRTATLIDGHGPQVRIGYDAPGRRAGVDGGPWTATSAASYGYDGLGRPAAIAFDFTGTGYDQSLGFGYNAAGGLASETRSNDLYAWGGHYAVNRGYATNGLNQYSQAGGATFAYDANGNLVSDGTTTYAYDVENRLTGVSGAHNAALAYDPLGRLWQLSTATAATRFILDGDDLVWETDGLGNPLRAYAHGPGADEPLIWYELGGGFSRRFLRADRQGSIVAAADDAGNAVAIDSYDEYGIPGAGNAGRFQYTAQWWLAEVGLYYYKARFYSPTLGRFMQTDPVGYADQYNLYEYVGDDPVNRTDPTGLLRNCAANDPNCIETPESEQQPGEPAPPSPEETETQTVTVTGHRPPIDYSGEKEQFFFIDNHVLQPRTMTWHTVHCSSGGTVRAGTTASIPQGTIPDHSHGDGLEQYPGPRDDNAALHASGRVAGLMTRNRTFTIRAFPNGTFRTRLTEGPSLTGDERTSLVENMRNWEHHPDPGPSQPLAARVCQ